MTVKLHGGGETSKGNGKTLRRQEMKLVWRNDQRCKPLVFNSYVLQNEQKTVLTVAIYSFKLLYIPVTIASKYNCVQVCKYNIIVYNIILYSGQ